MGTARGSLSTAGGYENRRGAWVIGENLEEVREDFKVFGVFQDLLTLAINVAFSISKSTWIAGIPHVFRF